jgi:hypothetical protein
MNKSETIGALAKALAKAQGSLENASKNAANPHFKSKYADLAECLNTIRDVFAESGLSYVQFPTFENGIASVETMLMHESGEWISSIASAPVSKQDAQGVGSATTYLRRYSIAAMAGIAQEDDDANSAVGSKPQSKPTAKQADNGANELWIAGLNAVKTASDMASLQKHFVAAQSLILNTSEKDRLILAKDLRKQQLTAMTNEAAL